MLLRKADAIPPELGNAKMENAIVKLLRIRTAGEPVCVNVIDNLDSGKCLILLQPSDRIGQRIEMRYYKLNKLFWGWHTRNGKARPGKTRNMQVAICMEHPAPASSHVVKPDPSNWDVGLVVHNRLDASYALLVFDDSDFIKS
jgi:hypothetical protein